MDEMESCRIGIFHVSHDFCASLPPHNPSDFEELIYYIARSEIYPVFFLSSFLSSFSRLPEATAGFPSDQRRLNAALENGTPVAGHLQHLRPDHHLLPVHREENSSLRVGYPEASRHAVHTILACKVDKRHSVCHFPSRAENWMSKRAGEKKGREKREGKYLWWENVPSSLNLVELEITFFSYLYNGM